MDCPRKILYLFFSRVVAWENIKVGRRAENILCYTQEYSRLKWASFFRVYFLFFFRGVLCMCVRYISRLVVGSFS